MVTNTPTPAPDQAHEHQSTWDGAPPAGLGLYTRLALAARAVGPIDKGERNKQQDFSYRSIEQITGRARTVFAQYGLALVPTRVAQVEYQEVQSARGSAGWRATVVVEYELGCEVYPAQGDQYRDSVQLAMAGEAIDYGDKATSKAVQMAYKYALTEALAIGAEQDADADSHQVVASRKVNPVVQAKQHVLQLAAGDKDRAAQLWAEAAQVLGMDPEQVGPDEAPAVAGAADSLMAQPFAQEVE